MLLTDKSVIKLCPTYANIVGRTRYAAYKLWNVCNYERRDYIAMGMQGYPDWYEQKSRLKGKLFSSTGDDYYHIWRINKYKIAAGVTAFLARSERPDFFKTEVIV